MQNQLVCSGCRTVLVYPRGALNVRCALCNMVMPVQSNGMEMDQIICGCCHTLLMYTRGAASVRCLCCHTVNLTTSNQVSTVRCGSCQMMLMYPYGAPSVKCAVCHYITNVGAFNNRASNPSYNPNGVPTTSIPASSTPTPPQSQTQTVVVENPMSFDESGKLVSNVVVGVTTEKK